MSKKIKHIELNELLKQMNEGSDNPIAMANEVLSNKIGDADETQSDIRLLYDWRVIKIVTTFDDIDNREHYSLEVKRKNEDKWANSAWCDTEDSALEHLNEILKQKYPSWVERCVFEMQDHHCKKFKYLS